MQRDRHDRTHPEGFQLAEGIFRPQFADGLGQALVVAVLHAQDGVPPRTLVWSQPNDALERERLAAAAAAVGGGRQVRAEGAGAAGAGRVRVGCQGGTAVGAEVAGAPRRLWRRASSCSDIATPSTAESD